MSDVVLRLVFFTNWVLFELLARICAGLGIHDLAEQCGRQAFGMLQLFSGNFRLPDVMKRMMLLQILAQLLPNVFVFVSAAWMAYRLHWGIFK